MKTLQLAMIMTLSLSVIFLVTFQHASADACSARLTSYNAPQFYLLSDGVFAGTVQHIDNTTEHQWKVYFTIDKLWRGSISQKPLMVMTNNLQGCGYSIVQGEKYLVYTNGYPPFFNTVWSKPYADARSDIAIIDDPKFQSSEKAQEELNKKLVIARDAISNLMGSKMGDIPFNSVGVDVINSTLDIGIDSAKAILSEEAYEKKIKDIVGDIPIKITFGQIVTDAPIVDALSAKNSESIPLSPLQQFKSGIASKDVQCHDNFLLTFKAKDGSPACVKPETAKILYERGWALVLSVNLNSSNSNQPVEVISILSDSSLTNPGGPPVKITLKNNGIAPITSLKATLHLNNEYVFDFANVTQSKPLIIGNLASDSKILIGAGFDTNLAHLLTISGIANNTQFNFTENVWISSTIVTSAKEHSINANVHDSFVVCDTPYPQSNTGIAVLYMPANSTGKLCVNYSNPNPSRSVDVRIFEARHLSEDTKDIQVLSSQDNIPQGNNTIVYTLKTSKVGFYGLTLFCYGTPLAVGYDNQSRIVANDFPWLGQTFYCPMQSYTFHISGLSGIGVKYIPYP